MNAVDQDAAPTRRLFLSRKLLGDNFYSYMYGVHRIQRIQLMIRARHADGAERASRVREARAMNHEALWYLTRIEVRQP